MSGILTRAMQKNALAALGIESDGTVASVTITPSAVVIVRVITESAQSTTEVRRIDGGVR